MLMDFMMTFNSGRWLDRSKCAGEPKAERDREKKINTRDAGREKKKVIWT